VQAFVAFYPAGDITLDAPQESARLAQRLVGALELFGVREG
jgi:hypothetical protein